MNIYKKVFLIVASIFFVLSTQVVAMEFPLPESNFMPARMPMYLVYPRGDTETQSHARHRWAHPSMQYQIPIGVQGGAWPFKYELINAPSGATIGSFHGDENYGVISWQPPANGTFTFKVRITDQQLAVIDADWQVTVDASQFVFVQDGHTGAKNGTINEPLEDVSDWYKGNTNDNTYHNKIIVFRGGNYTLSGGSDSNNNIRLLATTKTPSLIGFPGEVPIINASQSKILTDNSSLKDLFVAGIRWESSRQDVNNAHFFWAVGNVTRATWWNNYFYDHGPGIVGNDNTAAVFISSKDFVKSNVLYKGNTHDDFHNATSNGSLIDIYATSYVLIEENLVKNSGASYGFWMKNTTAFVSIRANEAYENISGRGISVGYGTATIETPHDHEVCWNRIVTQSSPATILWASNGANAGSSFNSYIYRNTFVNGSARIRFKGSENYETDGNVIAGGASTNWNTDIMTTTRPNLIGSGITDETGRLTSSSRQTLLGQVGFEVSDLNGTKIPKKPTNVIAQ